VRDNLPPPVGFSFFGHAEIEMIIAALPEGALRRLKPKLGKAVHHRKLKAFDSGSTPCHDVAMPDRKLVIVRFIGSTPSTAYCDVCKLAFRTRLEFVTDGVKAKQQLQSDFDKHECRPEDGAVNDALDHIR
jgi:hypothetical protein